MAHIQASRVHGVYSLTDAANQLGVSRVTLRHWIKQGWVAGPSVLLGGTRRYFSKEQLIEIAGLIESLKRDE